MAYDSSFGGVSAVNPQAKGNYQQYIDASYDSTKARLDPIFSDQRSAYDQSLINRGLPIGGESANRSMQQLDQNQNDAYSQAAFDAMGFGLGAQAQDFSQDATRSGLANALLQSQWGNETAKYGIDQSTGLGYAGLDENARQFDQGLGFQYDNLGQQNYQFDRGLDKSYYDTDSQYDYMYDRAGQDDYRFGVGQDRQDYYDQRQAGAYDDAFMMQLLGMGGTPSPYFQDPTSAYNAQIGAQTALSGQNSGFLSDLFTGGVNAYTGG